MFNQVPTRFGRQKSSKHRSCRSSFQACLGDRLACARSSAALAATPDYSHGLLLDHSITLVFFIIVIVEASAIAVTKRSELSRPRRLRWRWAAACVWRALFGRLRWTRDALVSPTHTSVMSDYNGAGRVASLPLYIIVSCAHLKCLRRLRRARAREEYTSLASSAHPRRRRRASYTLSLVRGTRALNYGVARRAQRKQL
eukprot:tig00000215_g18619.t1